MTRTDLSVQDASTLVSIIIPVYNGAQYIAEALESIFQQDSASYEVIVVDDGSTDNTREVLKPYVNRIHYVYQENAGPPAARNEGIRLAQGEFIGFLDADDFFLPGSLAEQEAVFERSPEAGAVLSGRRIVKQDGSPISDIEPWKWRKRIDLKALLLSLPIYLGSLIVRRAWIESLHGFDPHLRQAEDPDFFWRLALAGCRFAWLPKVTVAYRLHETNTSHDGRMALVYKKKLLETFFNRPDLPRNIRLLESQAWSQALLWHSWHAFFTGCTDDILPSLKELLSRQASPPEGEMILGWMEHFRNWHRDYGRDPSEIRHLWPFVRQVLSCDDELCEQLDRVLEWSFSQETVREQGFHDLPALWTFLEGLEAELPLNLPLEMVLEMKYGEIGQSYFQEKEGWHCLEKLARLRQIPQTDVIRFFQYLISKSSSLMTATQLQRLCHDLQHVEIITRSETYLCTPLYVTLFGQALLVHHAWKTALEALYQALKSGGAHPYSVKAWGRFIGNSIAYWFRRKKHHDGQSTGDKTGFIILGQARTGSTLLQKLLDSHPDIQCEGELFNPASKYIKRSLMLRLLQWYPFPYLEYRKRLSMKPVYGFKLHTHQIKSIQTRIRQLHQKGWKIIHLRRKNVVHQVLSLLIALKSKHWHRSEQEETPAYSISINPDEVLTAVGRRLEAFEEESVFLAEIPHLSVFYEDELLDDSNWDALAERLLNYLGLPWIQLSSELSRTDPRPYSEIVENWDELRRSIQSTFQDFYEDK